MPGSALLISATGAPSKPVCRVRLLGELLVEDAGRTFRPPRQAQRALACLALAGRQPTRGQLAAKLWPDMSESKAHAQLRTVVWRLGRFSARLVNLDGPWIGLAPSVEVDLHVLMSLAQAPAIATDDARALDLEFWHDDLLPDWDEEWLVIPRERVRQARLHHLEALCEHYIRLGRHSDAISVALTAIEADTLRESSWVALVRAHLAEGNGVEAVRQFAAYERILAVELGLAPSERFQELVPLARVR